MSRIIIDVREPNEFASGHVPDALNIPPATLMRGVPEQLKDIPKDTELILYCRTGSRSNASIQILKQYGFTNLTNGINQHHVETKYI